jgi:TRAP-type uncharacterized transport system substrate-binding protein
MSLQETVRIRWPFVVIAVTTLAVVAAAFVMLRTLPPRLIVMATGAEGGAYQEIGKRYQAILARAGVQLQLVPTDGALQNIAMLRDSHSGVGIALIQGGSTSEAEAPDIESLGTLFYEPLWTFARSDLCGLTLNDLRGRKVSVGPEGGGTRALALELLKRRGIDGSNAELFGYSPQVAHEKLLSGELDVAFMLVSWESPVITAVNETRRN